MRLKYINGLYPTTRQMFLNKYIKDTYIDTFATYKEKFDLEEEFDYVEDSKHKFYLNSTAFLIFDPATKKIVKLAFENFGDLVWIFQVMNAGDIEFELDNKVVNSIQNELEMFSDRIQILK